MIRCQQCRHEFSNLQANVPLCPKCGFDVLASESSLHWTSVARVTNLAEVGYFAHLLESQQIPTNIHQHNEFSALDGGVTETVFVLQVPRPHAAPAAELLKQELDGRDDLEEWNDRQDTLAAGGVWKPVVFVLMASGLAYCAGRGGMERPPVPAATRDSLWEALSESPAPLISRSAPNEPQRRLRFEPQSQCILLEEDFDGDGQTDRQRQFQGGQLVGEFVN